MGMKVVRGLVLGQDAGWVGGLMADVEARLAIGPPASDPARPPGRDRSQ